MYNVVIVTSVRNHRMASGWCVQRRHCHQCSQSPYGVRLVCTTSSSSPVFAITVWCQCSVYDVVIVTCVRNHRMASGWCVRCRHRHQCSQSPYSVRLVCTTSSSSPVFAITVWRQVGVYNVVIVTSVRNHRMASGWCVQRRHRHQCSQSPYDVRLVCTTSSSSPVSAITVWRQVGVYNVIIVTSVRNHRMTSFWCVQRRHRHQCSQSPYDVRLVCTTSSSSPVFAITVWRQVGVCDVVIVTSVRNHRMVSV